MGGKGPGTPHELMGIDLDPKEMGIKSLVIFDPGRVGSNFCCFDWVGSGQPSLV